MSLPEVFVISLTRSTERRARLDAHLAERGIPFRYFNAFDGPRVGIRSVFAYLRDHDWRYWSEHPPLFSGESRDALLVSNLALIKIGLCLGLEEMLILEDDVELCEGFAERFAEMRAGLPADWTTVHLGWGNLDETRLGPAGDNLAYGFPLQTEAVLYSRRAMEIIDREGRSGPPWDIFLWDRFAEGSLRGLVCFPERLARQLSADGLMGSTMPPLGGR